MKLVTDYLNKTVTEHGDKTAIVDEYGSLTFKELYEQSRKIASHLISKKIYNQPIIIYLHKSGACIASFLGAAYSGNFYTPIDEEMPRERVERIVNTLQPKCVITCDDLLKDAEEMFGCEIVKYDDIINRTKVDDEAIAKTAYGMIDTDPLYVLFTSGSTGNPKGVTICHKAVIDYTEWTTKTFDIDSTHTFGNQAPFYFDNSILDIYQMLKTGATMYIIPKDLFGFPIKLLEYIAENRINTIFWVPSALVLVANLRALGKRDVSCLKKILFCGEVMPNKQLNAWRKVLPDALYANLYGPTEITDVCTYYIVNREFNDDDPLPIGIPCENTGVVVLNDENKEVSGDEMGELCIRGTCLSLGYFNAKEITDKVFVQNPVNTRYHDMIYRTGDLVKYNEYGELIYCGRKDFQIKHMGHRIELGEIETATVAMNGVNSAACIYDDNKKKIVMFYEGTLSDKEIQEDLKTKIPGYMVPEVLIKKEKMPLTGNGKIDRVTLKKEYA